MEKTVLYSVYLPLLRHIRRGLYIVTLPYIDLKPSQLILGLSPGMEISFYSSDSMCTPLFWLSMWIIWQLVKPTAVPFPGRERDSMLCLQPNRAACRLRPCLHHSDYGEPTCTTEAFRKTIHIQLLKPTFIFLFNPRLFLSTIKII